jgi:hypothetical protein
MMNVSRGYSLPDAKPDAVALRRAELGGWILEATFGTERKTAGFATETQAAQVMMAMLMGKPVVEKAEAALEAAKAVVERKKPGPKKGWKKEQQVEQTAA